MKRQKVVKDNKKKKMLNQSVYRYMAVFEPDEEGNYNVSFPALPGCVTFGTTLAEAKRMAKEALELWIEVMLAEKTVLPKEKKAPHLESIEVAVTNP